MEEIMITNIYLDNINDIMKLICDQEEDYRIGRNRSSFLYRGLPNEIYRLETSIQRIWNLVY